MLNEFRAFTMRSFTRRSGSFTVQSGVWKHSPRAVMQLVIITGPSTALITSSAEMNSGGLTSV